MWGGQRDGAHGGGWTGSEDTGNREGERFRHDQGRRIRGWAGSGGTRELCVRAAPLPTCAGELLGASRMPPWPGLGRAASWLHGACVRQLGLSPGCIQAAFLPAHRPAKARAFLFNQPATNALLPRPSNPLHHWPSPAACHPVVLTPCRPTRL